MANFQRGTARPEQVSARADLLGRGRWLAGLVGSHWRPIVHWSVVTSAVGYVAWRVPGLADQLTQSSRQVHLRWPWLLVAALCGVAALVAYGELHRQLLLVGGANLPVTTVQGINFAENAVSTTVPVVGGAGALGYAISQLRRRGVDAALASWSVLLSGVIATLTLLVLGTLALGWSGRIPLLFAVFVAAMVIGGSIGTWLVATHPAVLRQVLLVLLILGHRMPGMCRTCRHTWAQQADRIAHRISERIALLQPHGTRWLLLIALAALSWVLDFLTLTTTANAVGFVVPWAVLVVGFLIVQGSIALQVLPGGAGLAETGLLGVMLAAGLAAAPAAASVLIYRAISWLGMSLVGWVIYAAQPHTTPTHRHRRPSAVPREQAPGDAASEAVA